MNLTPPSVIDAGIADGSREGRPEAGEIDADRPGLDASADMAPEPPDVPPDAPSDVPPDSTPDHPADTAVDIAPDRAPDTGPTASCPTDPALLLCLRFEGSLVDEAAPAATVTGTNVAFVAGIDGLAGRLDSSSVARVQPGWGALDGVFTLEAWIRPDRLPTGSQRLGILDEDSHFGLFLLPGGAVNCSSSGADATASAVVAAGQWTSVACTASANNLVLWIDGVARAQGQMDGISNGATDILGIGGNLPSGDPWEGLIDNVRIWNVARTAQQISAHTPDPP